MILRDYQYTATAKVFDSWTRFDNVLLVMATGLGKTVIFASIANDWRRGRVLVVAHRQELIEQAAEKIHAVTGERPAIEMRDDRSDERGLYKSRVVVASVQTLAQRKRLEKFRPDEFGLVVVDEAHHAPAKSYQNMLAHFDGCKVLGVTATPKRADGAAMGRVFDEVAWEYGILEGSDDGWLVPVRQRVVIVEGLDFSKVRQTCGELNEADLADVVTKEEVLHRVAAPACEMIGVRPCLVFCVNVKHAELMCRIVNRYKDSSAAWLSGESSEDERKSVVARFRAGQLPVLCNCGLFLEGFDAPQTAAIVMARPTKSLGLYTQMLGRGTRTLEGVVDGVATSRERRAAIARSGKPDLLVLDFSGNAGRHKIISADDILGGRFSDAVKKAHKEKPPKEGEETLLADELARVQAELELEEEQETWRKKIVAKATYSTRDVSPFDSQAMPGPATVYREAPSPRQCQALLDYGFSYDAIDRMSRKQAGFLIGQKRKAGAR